MTHRGGPPDATLKILGIDEIEQRVYETLIQHPAAAPAAIAEMSGLPERRLSWYLSRLESKGLVRRVSRRPSLYTAMAPHPALDTLILTSDEELQRARVTSARLMATFRQTSSGDDPSELIETVIGRANVLRRSQEVRSSARRLIRGFDKPPYLIDKRDTPAPELMLLRSGVNIRFVYDLESLRIPHGLEHIDLCVSEGEQARVAAVPLKLLIADDGLAFTTLQGATGPLDRAIVVKPSSLLDALTALFERTWEIASPWRTSRPTGTAAIDQYDILNDERLVDLLAAGLTDATIARQLGISHRTVQRRIRLLLDRLGVKTRFQAGIEATRRNWARH